MADSSRSNLRKLKDEYARNPGSRVFVHLAEAYRKAGELRQAHQVLADGLKRHVDYPSGLVVLAKVLADQGEAERAAAVWRDVVRLDPENVVALRALGDLAESAGRRDEAMQYYRRIVRLENGEPDADDAPFGAQGSDDDDDEPAHAPAASAPARGTDAPERVTHAPEPPQPALSKSRFSWLVRSVVRAPAEPARETYGFDAPAAAPAAQAAPAPVRSAPAAPSFDAEAPARVSPAAPGWAPAAEPARAAAPNPTGFAPDAAPEPATAAAPGTVPEPVVAAPDVASAPVGVNAPEIAPEPRAAAAPAVAPEPMVAAAPDVAPEPMVAVAPEASATPIAAPAESQAAGTPFGFAARSAPEAQREFAAEVGREPAAEAQTVAAEQPLSDEQPANDAPIEATQDTAPEAAPERAFAEIAAVEDQPEYANAALAAEPEPAPDEAEPAEEPAFVEEMADDDFPRAGFNENAAARPDEPFLDVDPEDPDQPYTDVRTEVPEPPVVDAELDEAGEPIEDEAHADPTMFAASREDQLREPVAAPGTPSFTASWSAFARGLGETEAAAETQDEPFEGIFGVEEGAVLQVEDEEVLVVSVDGDEPDAEPAPADEDQGSSPDSDPASDEARAEEVESQEEIVASAPEVEDAVDETPSAPVSFEELAQLAYDGDAREEEEEADPLAQIRAEMYGVDQEGAGETMPGVAAALAEVLVRLLERDGSVMHAESSLRRLLAVALARELGLNEAQQEALALAATLGAIGELREADAGDTGRNQAVTLQLLSGVALPDATREALGHQYERWDGAGLPMGLREENIPFPARVLAVARGAAALLGRNRGGAAAVVDELQRHAGTAFDPLVVSVLRRVFAQRERHGIGYGWGGRVAVAHPRELRGLELAQQLHAEGYEAETTQTAEALRQRLQEGSAEALIVGADLPDADVGALVRDIRSQAPGLPVLIVDAGDARRRVALLGAGADVCFPPDAEFLEVRATLDALLRRGEAPA